MSNQRYFIMRVWVPAWASARTGSLEVDAPHLNGVRRVMRHHFGVAQKALGPRLGILTLAVQRPAHEKSVKCPIISIQR